MECSTFFVEAMEAREKDVLEAVYRNKRIADITAANRLAERYVLEGNEHNGYRPGKRFWKTLDKYRKKSASY